MSCSDSGPALGCIGSEWRNFITRAAEGCIKASYKRFYLPSNFERQLYTLVSCIPYNERIISFNLLRFKSNLCTIRNCSLNIGYGIVDFMDRLCPCRIFSLGDPLSISELTPFVPQLPSPDSPELHSSSTVRLLGSCTPQLLQSTAPRLLHSVASRLSSSSTLRLPSSSVSQLLTSSAPHLPSSSSPKLPSFPAPKLPSSTAPRAISLRLAIPSDYRLRQAPRGPGDKGVEWLEGQGREGEA